MNYCDAKILTVSYFVCEAKFMYTKLFVRLSKSPLFGSVDSQMFILAFFLFALLFILSIFVVTLSSLMSVCRLIRY